MATKSGSKFGHPGYEVTSSLDHMILRDHVANKNHYISTTTVLMAAKLGRMVALAKLRLERR